MSITIRTRSGMEVSIDNVQDYIARRTKKALAEHRSAITWLELLEKKETKRNPAVAKSICCQIAYCIQRIDEAAHCYEEAIIRSGSSFNTFNGEILLPVCFMSSMLCCQLEDNAPDGWEYPLSAGY